MSKQQEFIEYLKPYAQVAEAKYGIDWRIVVAQAALETGWGSTMSRNPFNLWGMRFTGPAGVDPEGYALFSDQWEAVESYIYNLKKHHPTAWAVRNNPELFFQEIQNSNPPNTGAWAEDPQYTRKLSQIFSQYFSGETTAVDPTKPPEDTPDTASTYFPKTAEQYKKNAKDRKGRTTQQKRYYVKLQHVDADDEPRNALTIKITPDSQLLIVREKLIKVQDQEKTENQQQGGEQSQLDKQFTVEESISLQFQVDGLLLDYHNNAGQEKEAQKTTDQVQLRADYLALTRIKEGKKRKAATLLLGDDVAQLEISNDDTKSRIELYPQKILAKNSENTYLRLEKDIIQAKNKTESQVYLEGDLIVAENKTGSRVYLRGDYVEAKCKSGSYVQVTGDRVEAKCKSGSVVRITDDLVEVKDVSGAHVTVQGSNVSIYAPGTITINAGGTIHISGSKVYIN